MVIPSCLLFWSMINGIDPSITKAISHIESSNNPLAVGNNLDYGLLQIREKYVIQTKQQLLSPCNNIMVGTEMLRKAKEAFPMYPDVTYVSAFNLGIRGFKRIKQPLKFEYYLKVVKGLE